MNLNAGWGLDVTCGNNSSAFLADIHRDRLIGVGGEHQALDVEDDVRNIFDNTGNGGELVQNAFDANAGHCCTRDG